MTTTFGDPVVIQTTASIVGTMTAESLALITLAEIINPLSTIGGYRILSTLDLVGAPAVPPSSGFPNTIGGAVGYTYSLVQNVTANGLSAGRVNRLVWMGP